jgi:secondary thiamine-phosphate synthase enzyme
METLAPVFSYRQIRLRVTTDRRTEFVDLTETLEGLLADARLIVGVVNVQSLHTTAAIVVNEGEPLLLGDFDAMLEKAAPSGDGYRHDDPTVRTVNLTADERPNGDAHCKALLLGTSVCLNVAGGRLVLGRWQRVFLAEMDGPRQRDVSVLIMGESAR